ncbi:MAG: autotransporter-associated beta strand repeat-containing protein, partial [Gammaproteobacteria bacterium]|nr:autotransporter-associated beta strand repeat-containing protein [Gammaproteobacteria bacterium]
TNELTLTGNNTYSGGTFVNAGYVVLNSTVGRAFGTGNVTISGGASTNGNTYQERSSIVQFQASSQIADSATVKMLGGSTLDLNGFNQTLAQLIFDNTGGNTPTVNIGSGVLTLDGGIDATSANLGSVSTISTGVMNSNLLIGSPVVLVGSTAGLSVGTVVTGTGVPAGTTIAAILDDKHVLLSAAVTGSQTSIIRNTQPVASSTTSGSTTVTVASTARLTVGTPVSGPGIPNGATIAAILNGTQFTLSVPANATSGSPVQLTYRMLGSKSSLAFAGVGAIALSSGSHEFNVSAVTANDVNLAPLHPTLHIAGIMTGAGASINKTGNGILQLSGANTFNGGVTLSGGGILIGASSVFNTGT